MSAQKKPTTDSTTATRDLASAVRTLEIEAAGLSALARSLDDGFAKAVDAIHDMKGERRGRLIVAGIGKSGHVAKKIVATLASTGTPAYFVHPGEASHGDLGMITETDIVLMLSNSGESAELSDMIAYTRRFGITLIAITSNPGGALAKHADIRLILPKVPEACPNGLAPTTSTTMTMALGDALAVALLERIGLTPEQFKVFHPGGKLGSKLRKISDLMHPLDKMPLIDEAATMGDALIILTNRNLGSVVVVNAKKELRGIITDGDLKRHMGPDLFTKPVTAVMTKNPKTIEAGALAAEALDMMSTHFKTPVTCLVVTDGGKLAGLIRMQDCLQAGIA